MKQIPSPNFNARDAQVPLDKIVLHYTGMKTAAEALVRLCDPAARVSAHYMIDEDGSVIQLVAEKDRAWHAGQSFWRDVTDLNSASIGIELVNPGHEFGYRPFPAAQIASLKDLLRGILARHKMNPATALLAHSDIAPARKQDPGEFFPWQELAQEGLGVWGATPFPDNALVRAEDITSLLQSIGYDTTDLSAALLAFQRRYVPKILTGLADNETLARLCAISLLRAAATP